MTDKKGRKSSSGGAGTVTLLWVIFLILKLTNVIDWKWLWVFSPIWISASAAVGLGLLFLLVVGLILLAAIIGITRKDSKAVDKIKEMFRKKD
ncbi:MAG: hypothetical protein H7645_10915 [Candidatus Heimdallarchaeota archaeon]|nr:hypothetical protein [Candidatus Heimdallarchaeota archaeon]MCK4770836.1 hypothetical protein [Candidatus Heimdallarchaeota archaeon]